MRWPSTVKTLLPSIKYITYLYRDTWSKHSVKGQVAFCYLGMRVRCVHVTDAFAELGTSCMCYNSQYQMQAAQEWHRNPHFPVTALHQILAMFSDVLSVTPFFHACSLIVIARQYAHSCHWTCSAPRLGISPLVGWVSRYKLLWQVHQVNWQPLL